MSDKKTIGQRFVSQFPLASRYPDDPDMASKKEKEVARTIDFFASFVPKTKKERINLLFELNLLAKEFSDCKLIIKPRFPEKIGHAHRLKYPLTELINKIDNKESNLIFSNKELSKLFPQTKFSLTISSTAGIESLLLGIPTYFINNYCKGINKYGSDDFNSFNTVTSINKIPDILSNKINY